MTQASKFLKRLDQVLSKSCNEFHERDIDAPQVMHEVVDDLRKLLAKASMRWSGFSGQVPSLTLRRGTAPEKGVPTHEQTPHPQP